MESVNFDRAADFYDATRGFPDGIAKHIGQFIAESGHLSSNDSLLEIGIGTGRIALPLAPYVKFIAGADISRNMMQVLLSKRHNEAIFPVQADAHDLPYASNIFDAVVIVHVLHLVPEPVRILKDVKRVLKREGCLLHCFTAQGIDDDNPVVTAWNAKRPKRKRGYNWRQTAEALDLTGWVQEEELTFTYNYTETPQTILDSVKNKVWSSLWDVTDEAIAPAVEAITQAVNDHYNGDFKAEMPRTSGLTMQILKPSV